MDEEKKHPREAMMERDCIILLTANEILTAVRNLLPEHDFPEVPIDTKCKGDQCAQYRIFSNVCGLIG